MRGFTIEVHFGWQEKHLPGRPGYDATKSALAIDIKKMRRAHRDDAWDYPLLQVGCSPGTCIAEAEEEGSLMSYFHPAEEFQVAVLERYASERPEARYLVEFDDGGTYLCEYEASWASENSADLNIDTGDPMYDEFHQVGLHVLEVVRHGNRGHREGGYFAVDYRDFPAKVTDMDTNTVVYSSS